ncbi:hypothetical protein BVU_2156 [Phocaeicola vulgatus ATCC 8482]|uniref:Uncharacterized protein n=1 Tax=Phocaeicola vulgatus (strain ATCC 8482 / DSM 1447 / JCM 5826 / CCUG 4940 / NBRC 14291 / NCTC 11154) TaxID=435590 RepID=A6L2A3_PHOV8|nr:hypothetical protein BVU_2156 [Phocaeicola vulgatus ATCC 8482]
MGSAAGCLQQVAATAPVLRSHCKRIFAIVSHRTPGFFATMRSSMISLVDAVGSLQRENLVRLVIGSHGVVHRPCFQYIFCHIFIVFC